MPSALMPSTGRVPGPVSNMTMLAPPAVGPLTVPPLNLPPVPQAPAIGAFGTPAPTSTPYGDFQAPDPLHFDKDPSYQFRLDEGNNAIQRSAAARGTLLNGGTLKALQANGQGAASQEYNNAFTRALQGYTANRDTNQQNFGQATTTFNGNLGAFGANTSAALGAGRLALDSSNVAYDHAQDQRQQQMDLDRQAFAHSLTERAQSAAAQIQAPVMAPHQVTSAWTAPAPLPRITPTDRPGPRAPVSVGYR